MSAWRNHFDNVIGWIPKSAAICSSVTPASRPRATRTTSSRNSFGNGFGIATSFQAHPQGKPNQMSPPRAADPVYDNLVVEDGATAEMRPVLLKSLTSSPDAQTWTFKLRPNVKFTDGTPFDAAAIK